MFNSLNMIISRVCGFFFKNLCYLSSKINASSSAQFRGVPLLELHSGAKLSLGDNVLINSSNYGYHINMHSRTKIVLHTGANLTIGENSRLHGVSFHSRSEIIVGSRVLMAAGTIVIDNNGHSSVAENRLSEVDKARPIYIGDDVWLAANVVVTPGSYIGNNVIVSANSVVKGHLESNFIYAGNPAVAVKKLR